MLSSISRGDTVVSAGGFFGKVSDILDDSYIIEIAEGVKVRILKNSISSRRDQNGGKPKQHRPKKKKKIGESAVEAGAETKPASEEGVTSDENSILMGSLEEQENKQGEAEFSAGAAVSEGNADEEKDKVARNADHIE
jgi:preprotein translocase subunit YajC